MIGAEKPLRYANHIMLFPPLKPSMVSIALKIKLKIFEVTDIKLDLAVQPLTTHLLTHHTVGTLTFPQFLKSTTLLCLEAFVLLSMLHKDAPTLPLASPTHPACLSPKVTSSEGPLRPRILCS